MITGPSPSDRAGEGSANVQSFYRSQAVLRRFWLDDWGRCPWPALADIRRKAPADLSRFNRSDRHLSHQGIRYALGPRTSVRPRFHGADRRQSRHRSWVPGEDTKIVIPDAHLLPDGAREGLVLNLADQRIYYYAPNSSIVESHPIGIGNVDWETPKGTTRVIRKRKNPIWRVPKSIRAEQPELPAMVMPGPKNPLGKFALDLSMPAYLIHGTNKPLGVGRRVSHGCIRLYPEDILTLFRKVAVGTPVAIVDQTGQAGLARRRAISGSPYHPESGRRTRSHGQIHARSGVRNRIPSCRGGGRSSGTSGMGRDTTHDERAPWYSHPGAKKTSAKVYGECEFRR